MLGDGWAIRVVGKALAMIGLDFNAQDALLHVDSSMGPSLDSHAGHGDFPIHMLSDLPGGDLREILRATGGGIGAPVLLATPQFVAKARAAGLAVFVFSVDSRRAARRVYERCRPDIIFANRAELFAMEEDR
jgi:hypothetical protein